MFREISNPNIQFVHEFASREYLNEICFNLDEVCAVVPEIHSI